MRCKKMPVKLRDWDAYKHKEGLDESLKNASATGYLAKKDFLERADVRQFEQERDFRNAQRAKQDEA